MKESYSYKKAAAYSAVGLAVNGLAGAFYAAVHHGWYKHFDTFTDAFAHVAQPQNIAIAVGLSVIIGAGIEFAKWHNRNLDLEENDKIPPKPGPSPRQ